MPETTSRRDASIEPEPPAEPELVHAMPNVEVSSETAPPRSNDVSDVDMPELEVLAFVRKYTFAPAPLRQHSLKDTKKTLCPIEHLGIPSRDVLVPSTIDVA